MNLTQKQAATEKRNRRTKVSDKGIQTDTGSTRKHSTQDMLTDKRRDQHTQGAKKKEKKNRITARGAVDSETVQKNECLKHSTAGRRKKRFQKTRPNGPSIGYELKSRRHDEMLLLVSQL